MKNILFIIFSLISLSLFSQEKISGVVLEAENQMPIEGATVLVQGTSTSVNTDKNGRFEVSFKEESKTVLVINHLAYEQALIDVRLPITGKLVLHLRRATSVLDEVEVVSTGYQTIPKDRATGSFSVLSNELLNQQVGPDILSRLPAIANSFVVDYSKQGVPEMLMRGLGSFEGPNEPLIVVDNFPYEGDIASLNPNIVENITFLKDAAASSIWGARAANGVIVITTKAGRLNEPIKFSFNSNLSVSGKPDLGYIRQMSSADFIEVERELFNRDFYNNDINSTSYPIISPVVELLIQVKEGTLPLEEAEREIERLKSIDVRDQFNKYIYTPAINQQYFLDAQGGGEKFAWMSSVGFDNNKSDLDANYQRTSLRFQNVFKPIDKLSLTSSLSYTQNRNKSGKQGYNNISVKNNSFLPYMEMVDSHGNPLPVAKEYRQSLIDTVGNGQLLDWNYYPLTDWQHQISTRTSSEIITSVNLNYNAFRGFTLAAYYQNERKIGLNTTLYDEDSYMTRNYINGFTQIENGNPKYIVPMGAILNKSENLLSAHNIRGQLNYDYLSGKHELTAIAGMEARSVKNNGHQNRFYGYDPSNLSTTPVDYVNSYPNFITKRTNTIVRNQSLSSRTNRFLSYFFNGAYTFDNKYTLSVSARNDASNLFGLKTNDQWNPFWSAGIAWKVSNESFYSSELLSNLNLRLTYGFNGNINPAMVAATTISYSSSNSAINGNPIAAINNYYNPELKWETSKMLNFAADFTLLSNRVSGTVEYYQKKGSDLFGRAMLDYTTGVSTTMTRNVASMSGKGVDLEIKSLILNRELKWQSIVNFSLYKDEVKDYQLERTRANEFVSGASTPISGIPGNPVYSVFAYKWAGLDPETGEPRGYVGEEVSKDYSVIMGTGTKLEELEFFGSAIPTKFGSFINTFSYKDFSLQFSISYKLGYWFRRNSIRYSDLFAGWRGHSDYALRWQKPGDELRTDVPSNDFTTNSTRESFYQGTSVLVEKGDQIRLQYINFVYNINFPPRLSKGLQTMQVYLNASNLGLIWSANKSNLDPEVDSLSPLKAPINYSIGIRTKF